jgi:ATP-binding cassette subfamily B protein
LNAAVGEVEAAARGANARDFIISLSQVYDTQLGERGAMISGVEQQRISIARTLLKNPQPFLP